MFLHIFFFEQYDHYTIYTIILIGAHRTSETLMLYFIEH